MQVIKRKDKKASEVTNTIFFFFRFPNLFAICIHTLNTISKLCVEKRGQVEECSVAPLRDKRVKTFLAVGEKRVQTKENTN
jgi:hypothetical protein